MTRWTIVAAALMALSSSTVHAQDSVMLRFSDTDGDGVNDLFRDANGDGKNDLDGRKYRHRFLFRDTDGDGVNDLFRDANGDGKNDLAENADSKSASRSFVTVLDYDNDGMNDVTGEKYTRSLTIRSFVDENGDGIDDRETWTPVKALIGKIAGENRSGRTVVLDKIDESTMDRFIDENRDGINDGRNINDKQLITESLNNATP